MRDLKANIWKYFVFSFTQRRNFIPLVSIFFLTLPNTTANQIGLYTGIGFLAGLFLEIPSSYFADRIGHKQTLLIAKICMAIATFLLVIANEFWYFAVASALISIATSFTGGVGDAFMHDTLKALKRENDYTRVMSRISAYVSLISGIIIVLLPFFTAISIRLPFQIWLFIDIIGVLIVASMTVPPREQDTAPRSFRQVIGIIKKAARPGFYPFAIFSGAIAGFLIADSAYRYVYLQALGYPIIFIGAVMGLSRFVWFLIGNNIRFIERIPIARLMQIELFLFPIAYVLVASSTNPYVVGLFFSVIVGYFWAREQVYTNHIIRKYIVNAHYKATMLSVANQIDDLFQMTVAFAIAGVMVVSYSLGFLTLGICLFIVLTTTYFFTNEARTASRA